MIRLSVLVLALLANAGSAHADVAADALAAKQRLEAASVLLQEAASSRDQVAALTETVRAYEDGLVSLRDGLRRAAIRQRAVETELSAKSDEVARLLGVLETMNPEQGPLILLNPSGPLGTVRSGLILADVTPAIQTRVDELRAQLEEVAILGQLQDGAADTLRDGLTGAQEARAELTAAIQDRTDLPRRFTEDPVQTALLIASTETLDAFANGLAGTVTDITGDAPDATARKGTLALPVQGQVLRRFNETDAAGVTRPGLVIATRPRALVTTPVAATVRFRGPLLDYGNVIILEPAADVLFVIAGLAEVFGEPGQVVPEGTAIGLMGGTQPAVDAILTETGLNGAGPRSETLYLEVRDGQSPVDPATWFAAQ
jgi:septal ring factor EnvC (AmiA/AmiB activator)